MTRKTLVFAGLFVALGFATNASAQILDGEYFKGTLSGKTRTIVDPPSTPTEGGFDPATATLDKGKLKKTVFYIQTLWNSKDQAYDLSIWTEVGTSWVETTNSGELQPFGDGFPDTKDGGLSMFVDLAATAPSEGGVNQVIEVEGLVTIKSKEDKKASNPGEDEVQTLTVGGADAGSYTLAFDGEATGPLLFDAGVTDIQTALEGLSTIGGAANVSVGAMGTDFTITFTGTLGKQDVLTIVVNDTTTGGSGVVVMETTKGSAATSAVLKSGSFKLDQVGSIMGGEDFEQAGTDFIGSPKFSAKRVSSEKLPFTVPGPL